MKPRNEDLLGEARFGIREVIGCAPIWAFPCIRFTIRILKGRLAPVDLGLFHLKRECPRELLLDITTRDRRRKKTVRNAFLKGHYEKVADVSITELDLSRSLAFVWIASQNNLLTDSWSRRPLPAISPEGDGTVLHKGKRLGRRSTRVGDVITVNGRHRFFISEEGFLKF